MLEDVLVMVGDLILPADSLVLDMEEDCEIPIILGQPFLATANAVINVPKGEIDKFGCGRRESYFQRF